MSYNINLPSLIIARRLLFSLALLIGLAFGLASLLPTPRTDFNLTCGDSIGLIQAINQANTHDQAFYQCTQITLFI